MQTALNTPSTATAIPSAEPAAAPAAAGAAVHPYAHYQIIRRNGAVVPFEPQKIAVAMMKAFLAVHGTQGAASASVRETVDGLTQGVVRAMVRSRPGGGTCPIEVVHALVAVVLIVAIGRGPALGLLSAGLGWAAVIPGMVLTAEPSYQ